jgi:hypothetical protein
LLRLLNDAMGDQGGWLLALAIVGGLSALATFLASRSWAFTRPLRSPGDLRQHSRAEQRDHLEVAVGEVLEHDPFDAGVLQRH